MNSLDWVLLKSRQVVRDRWLSVRADTCQMPDGRIVEPYYVFEFPAWVNVVALTEANEVILVRQYRHGVQATMLELPCGTVEPSDASPLDAIQRELLEETGYTAESFIETGRLSANPANHSNLTHCFLATGARVAGQLKLDDTEQIETRLVSIEKLTALVETWAIYQALHVGSIWLALKRLGRA